MLRDMRRRRPVIRDQGIEAVLGPLAGPVMRIILKEGEMTVRAVAVALAEKRERAPAYTTVMTIMARLHERGLLERVKRGRGYVYRPAADEQATIDELSRRAVDQLLQIYGTSAMRRFAFHLGDLDRSQREELIRLAESAKSKT